MSDSDITAPNANPFSLATPRRPGIDDYNGAILENVPGSEPGLDMPEAAALNTSSYTHVAVGAMIALAKLTIDGATPAIVKIMCPNEDADASNFHVARHVAGDDHGDWDITWDANILPTSGCDPDLTINSNIGSIAIERFGALVTGARAVRVRTRDGSGVGTDCRFTLTLY